MQWEKITIYHKESRHSSTCVFIVIAGWRVFFFWVTIAIKKKLLQWKEERERAACWVLSRNWAKRWNKKLQRVNSVDRWHRRSLCNILRKMRVEKKLKFIAKLNRTEKILSLYCQPVLRLSHTHVVQSRSRGLVIRKNEAIGNFVIYWI